MFYLNFPSPGITGMRQGMGSDGDCDRLNRFIGGEDSIIDLALNWQYDLS